MKPIQGDRLVYSYKSVSEAAGAIVTLVGLLALIGWMTGNVTLKSLSPNMVAMKANTAAAFLLSGASLWLSQLRRRGRYTGRAATLLAALVVFIGAFTLLEYIAGWDGFFDNILFVEPPGALLTSHPGRMAPNTAFNFILMGTALIMLDFETARGRRPAQPLAVLAGLVSLLAFVGYAFGITSLYGIKSFTPMAVTTATGFLILSTGTLLARPEKGMMLLLSSASTGGMLARRLIVVVSAAALVMGWLGHAGQRANLYGAEFGYFILVAGFIVIFSYIVWRNALLLESIEAERRHTEEALLSAREELEMMVAERTAELTMTNEALRESEDRFRLLVEGVRDYAIFMLDPKGRVVSWNEGARRIKGYEAGEIIGKDFSCFYTDEDVLHGNPTRELGLAAAVGNYETDDWRVRKDGSRFWANAAITALRDESGTLKGFSKVTRDITEKKRAEDQVKKLNAELERRVIERTAQLEAANKELEAFSYSVSHDLRAPLRSIDGFSQAILEDYNDVVDEQGKDYLRRVRAATQRMGRLIDDMLKLSRVGRAEMRHETVNLSGIAGKTAAELAAEHPDRSVEFLVENGLMATGDLPLLRIVLDNLLGNAFKFTAKRTDARVEFCTAPGRSGPVFCVRDNGAGFDMAYSDKLFVPFQRLHSDKDFPGTGIGLVTVQRIIHRHGGKVWAESEVGKGTTFYFTIGRADSLRADAGAPLEKAA